MDARLEKQVKVWTTELQRKVAAFDADPSDANRNAMNLVSAFVRSLHQLGQDPEKEALKLGAPK